MGLSRNTVKKYLEVSEPKRLELNPRSRPVVEGVKPRMDQLQRNSDGDRTRAMSLLDESLTISRELGMRPLMERVLSRRDVLKA